MSDEGFDLRSWLYGVLATLWSVVSLGAVLAAWEAGEPLAAYLLAIVGGATLGVISFAATHGRSRV